MASVSISTNSIEILKNNNAKLKEFRTTESLRDACSTHREYVSTLSVAIFTLINDSEEDTFPTIYYIPFDLKKILDRRLQVPWQHY